MFVTRFHNFVRSRAFRPNNVQKGSWKYLPLAREETQRVSNKLYISTLCRASNMSTQRLESVNVTPHLGIPCQAYIPQLTMLPNTTPPVALTIPQSECTAG